MSESLYGPIDHTCTDVPRKRNCECAKRRAAFRRERQRASGHARGVYRYDNLRRRYKMTPQEYEELREAQGRRCAICRRHEDEIRARRGGRPRADGKPPKLPRKLSVDHCHAGGHVRALLCQSCNVMLGNALDRPDVLEAGAEYLRTHRVPSQTKRRRS